MLKYLPVSRSAHDNLKGDNAKLLELLAQVKHERDWARTQCDDAVIERDEANTTTLKAIEQRDAISDIATRALNLLNEVDTTRTGGKPLKALIVTLLADAKEHGLWGELPTKED